MSKHQRNLRALNPVALSGYDPPTDSTDDAAGRLTERLMSPFSTEIGYTRDKVLGGDIVLPNSKLQNLVTFLFSDENRGG